MDVYKDTSALFSGNGVDSKIDIRSAVDLLQTESYDYELPEKLIAQNPANPRDSSRLLVMRRNTGGVRHCFFRQLTEIIRPSDLLVLNDTRVLPARLHGTKSPGTASIEILLLRPQDPAFLQWEALVRPARRMHPGMHVILQDGTSLTVLDEMDEGIRILGFPERTDVLPLLDRIGDIPLPPYITRSSASRDAYQTVFAKNFGSCAAPTASLHFTESLLDSLRALGVRTAWITLHVGLGTFRPVSVTDIRHHHMHSEWCSLPDAAVAEVLACKKRGGRVIAAGTTVARTLESFARDDGSLAAGRRDTSLFIFPGYRFRVIDGLITNFHLPKSTLLMLVCAFGGYESVMHAYREAVSMRYRFFSFGDAMMLL